MTPLAQRFRLRFGLYRLQWFFFLSFCWYENKKSKGIQHYYQIADKENIFFKFCCSSHNSHIKRKEVSIRWERAGLPVPVGRKGNGPTLIWPTLQPSDRSTESDRKIPRHPIEKLCNGPIRFLASVKRFQWCHRTESKIRSDDTIYLFFTFCFLSLF